MNVVIYSKILDVEDFASSLGPSCPDCGTALVPSRDRKGPPISIAGLVGRAATPFRASGRCDSLGNTRQAEKRFAPGAIVRLARVKRTAVRLRDLPAERQADAGTARFRGKEGDEEIARIHDAGPFITEQKLRRNRPCASRPFTLSASFAAQRPPRCAGY